MKTKNTLILIFLVLAALVLSALITTLTGEVSWLKWLTWGESIGFDIGRLDLAIIDLPYAGQCPAGSSHRRGAAAI